jgi:membrane-bound acyltransferase YfiQ involved in biofilm formation
MDYHRPLIFHLFHNIAFQIFMLHSNILLQCYLSELKSSPVILIMQQDCLIIICATLHRLL